MAWTIIFLLAFFQGFSQSQKPDQEKYRNQTDGLFKVATALCEGDSTKNQAWSWVLKSNMMMAILEDAILKEKYKNLDLHLEISSALNQAIKLDKKKEYLSACQNALASNTIDISNLALSAMENAKRFKSKEDADKAISLISLCLENYKETGKSQKLVDRFWAEEKLDWRWLRFYKAVCMRMAGQNDNAEKEYGTLLKMGWNEPTLICEFADFQTKNAKQEETKKILENGFAVHPENPEIACMLTRYYLDTDQLKKAQATIKPLDGLLRTNARVAITKALVYEKKGDYKKADAIFKAVLQSDKFEVETNREFAGYLIRKAANSDKSDAEEFAQQAYNLMARAMELSPANEGLKSEWQSIKTKYPKVYKEEEPE